MWSDLDWAEGLHRARPGVLWINSAGGFFEAHLTPPLTGGDRAKQDAAAEDLAERLNLDPVQTRLKVGSLMLTLDTRAAFEGRACWLVARLAVWTGARLNPSNLKTSVARKCARRADLAVFAATIASVSGQPRATPFKSARALLDRLGASMTGARANPQTLRALHDALHG